MQLDARWVGTSSLVLLLVLAGACTSSSDGDASGADDESRPDGERSAATDAEGDREAGDEPFGRLELSGWEITHPGGTTVALRAIEVDDAGDLYVELEAISTQREIRLARFDTFLVDDGRDIDAGRVPSSERHDLVAPGDNPELRVAADERLTATLAFEGPIDPAARRVTLALNGAGGHVRDPDHDPSPAVEGPTLSFRDIPLPGVGLDDEAATDAPVREDLTDSEVVEVEVTEVHDRTGLEVTVTRIEFDGRNVLVDLEVANPSGEDLMLAREDPRVTSDTGARSTFVSVDGEDPGERRLEIPAASEASVTLGFRAPMRGGNTMTLELNWPPPADRPAQRRPYLIFEDLPVPGREAGDGNGTD